MATAPTRIARQSYSGRSDAGVGPLRLLAIPLLLLGAGLLLAASIAPTAGLAASIVRTVDSQLLDYPPLPDDLRQLSERSLILDRDGGRLAFVREENRVLVELAEVPEHVREAVIATEDQDFYEHEGVNWPSIARAAAGNIRAGEITSGGSTITQQLVKNLVLETNEQTFDRKLQEAVYAIDLEERMTKNAILEDYLNTAFFANRVYGIGAAAEFYWGKPVSELTVSEGAVLAGMLRSPEVNDPIDNPEAARGRRDIVLAQMAAVGYLSPGEADRLAAEPLTLAVRDQGNDVGDDDIVDYIVEELKSLPALGDDPDLAFRYLATGGLQISTTIDADLSRVADEAIAAHLSSDVPALGALTAVDPRTGEVLAIGFGPHEYGTGEGQVDVNPAVPGLGAEFGRQSGSAFKAFEIVTALEAGVSPALTLETPSPYVSEEHCTVPEVWEPGNYADSGGGVMDMERATTVSSNVYFAHLVDQLTGPAALQETAARMGLDHSHLDGVCASVLGTDGTYPLDMASGFGTLANNGVHCETYVIAEVRDRNGRVLHRGGDRCDPAVDPGIAARATDLLRGPIEGGTAARNGDIGRPAAGKTGTTQGFKDAWFVGFVPQLSAAVWMGYEEGEDPLTHPDCPDGVTGGCVPTSIWADFMRGAMGLLDLPVEGFPDPPPIPTSQVPSVVGRDSGAASVIVEEAGFRAVVDTVSDHRPAGTVVEQSPGGGSSAPTGSAVRLMVSDGTGLPPTIPDLTGLTVAEAQGVVRALGAGLFLRAVEVPVDDIGRIGAVVGQRPAAGSELVRDITITVEVGRQRGPEDEPTGEPTEEPTGEPTEEPTGEPTGEPTEEPTRDPTEEPTPGPTDDPTEDGRPPSDEQDDPPPRGEDG